MPIGEQGRVKDPVIARELENLYRLIQQRQIDGKTVNVRQLAIDIGKVMPPGALQTLEAYFSGQTAARRLKLADNEDSTGVVLDVKGQGSQTALQVLQFATSANGITALCSGSGTTGFFENNASDGKAMELRSASFSGGTKECLKVLHTGVGDGILIDTSLQNFHSAIDCQGHRGSLMQRSQIRMQAYSPALELRDKDNTVSWNVALSDNDSDSLVMGRGSCPGDGIMPAFKIDTSDQIYLGTNASPVKSQMVFTIFLATPAIAAGGQKTNTFGATGVAVGDICRCSHTTDYDPGVLIDARVAAADLLRVTVFNQTSGSYSLPGGTLRVQVWHY